MLYELGLFKLLYIMDKQKSKFVVLLLSVLTYFFLGAASIFYGKGFTMQYSRQRLYEHPFFTCLLMFIGEYSVYFLFKLTKPCAHYNCDDNLPKLNPFILAIPSLFDLLASTLSFFAFFFLAASVSQMMMSGMMVITCILSIAFLKKQYYRHHWTGLLIILIGVSTVAINAIIQTQNDPNAASTNTKPLGVIMYLSSVIFQAFQCVAEEAIFRKYTCHPMEAVGYEGASGVFYFLILLPIFQFVKVPVYISRYGVLENTVEALSQIASNKFLLVMVLTYPIVVALLNIAAQGVTKYSSALHRTILAQCRTILVWIVAMIIGWEKFYILQLVGFLIVILGTLIYNEILVLPCCGFNLYTKKALRSSSN